MCRIRPFPLPGLKGQGDLYHCCSGSGSETGRSTGTLSLGKWPHSPLELQGKKRGERSAIDWQGLVFANTKEGTHTYRALALPGTWCQDNTSSTGLYLRTRETSREAVGSHKGRRLKWWCRKACCLTFKFSQRRNQREIHAKQSSEAYVAFASISAFQCL